MIDNGKVLNWLLEESNPSSRYLTMVNILAVDKRSKEGLEQENRIYESTIFKKIISKMNPEGYFNDKDSPYSPKFKSSYWQPIILSQIGASIRNKKVLRSCEFIFSLQHQEGGFPELTYKKALNVYDLFCKKLKKRGKSIPERESWVKSILHETQLSCLTGNLITSFLKLGHEPSDPRIRKAIDWLVKVQNSDGGWLCPYWRAHIKDKHSCFTGSIAPLDALSEIPEKERTPEMNKSIEKCAEFFLMHRLFKADHHDFRIIKDEYLRFHFPVFWFDLLRVLLVISKLGYIHDKRAEDGLNVLLSKQTEEGFFNLDRTFEGRMYVSFGKTGMPNKWVTMSAIRVFSNLNK